MSRNISPVTPPSTHDDCIKYSRRPSADHLSCETVSSPSPRQDNPTEPYIMVHLSSPWARLRCLGTLIQSTESGVVRHKICVERVEPRAMVMVRPVEQNLGLEEASMLRRLAHPNVIELRGVFLDGGQMHLELDYCRWTLLEVFYGRVEFEEVHVRFVAQSLFAAIRHISAHQIVHNNISGISVRVCERNMQLVLSGFENATSFHGSTPNTDLEMLGITLLQCMDGKDGKDGNPDINIGNVRGQRTSTKFFGLKKPDRWTGAEQLIDFLDDLFSEEKSAASKLENPVRPSTLVKEKLAD